MTLPEKWELPTSLRARVGKTLGRQRTIQEEEHTVIMIHHCPTSNDKHPKGACCWIKPNDEIHFHPNTATFERLFEEYHKHLDHLEKKYDQANSAIEYFTILEEIVPLHFAATRMANALQMARDLLPENRQVLLWRDETFEIQRESELLQAYAKNALDYHQAKSTEDLSQITYELSKTSHKLNMLATLFVPMMAVAGLFGMNVFSGFEKEDSYPLFWIITVFCILLGVAVNFYFRVPKK